MGKRDPRAGEHASARHLATVQRVWCGNPGRLSGFLSKAYYLGLELLGEPMTDDINGGRIDPEFAGDSQHAPVLPAVEVEDLKMFRGSAAREPVKCGGKEALLPFVLPGVGRSFRGLALDRCGAMRIAVVAGTGFLFVRLAGAILVRDPPTGEVQQPATEGAAGRVALELVDGLGHTPEDVLCDFFRVGVRQS